jgi:luciferase family oxidoreductase group 1
VAEHHSSPSLACPAPEIMVGHIAAATSRIRVGTGGVMLPHYSPLKVAEQFKLLEALHPGRIDLGIGRAPGTDPLTTHALGQMADRIERFPDDVVDLIAWLQDGHAPGSRYERVTAMPLVQGAPALWMLGSSAFGGAVAAQLGIPFCFAHFINPEPGPVTMAAYRQRFRPLVVQEPVGSVGVSVICADTDEEAVRLSASIQVWRHLARRGRGGPIPTVEEAQAVLNAWGESPWRPGGGRMILGSPARVRDDLEALAAEYGVDEVLVVTITHDHGARVRSYELLAQAFQERQ